MKQLAKKLVRPLDKYIIQSTYLMGILLIGFGTYWMFNPPPVNHARAVVANTYNQLAYLIIGGLMTLGGMTEIYNMVKQRVTPLSVIPASKGGREITGQTLGSLIGFLSLSVFFIHSGYVYGDYLIGFVGALCPISFVYTHILAMEENREEPYFNKYTHRWVNR